MWAGPVRHLQTDAVGEIEHVNDAGVWVTFPGCAPTRVNTQKLAWGANRDDAMNHPALTRLMDIHLTKRGVQLFRPARTCSVLAHAAHHTPPFGRQ